MDHLPSQPDLGDLIDLEYHLLPDVDSRSEDACGDSISAEASSSAARNAGDKGLRHILKAAKAGKSWPPARKAEFVMAILSAAKGSE